MLQIRTGTNWSHEAGHAAPMDAFTIEVDGVALVPRAAEEPLATLVPALLSSVSALCGGSRAVDLSLEESQLELCWLRTPGSQVLTSVVDLATLSVVHHEIAVELVSLREAALTCGRSFQRALRQAQHAPVPELEAALESLTQRAARPLGETPAPGVAFVVTAPGGFRIDTIDEPARLRTFDRTGRGALASLLGAGAAALPPAPTAQRAPFLHLLHRVRQGGPGSGAAVFELGLAWALMARTVHPPQAQNPWLESLVLKCTEGLAALRPPRASAPPPPHAAPASQPEPPEPPLSTPGVLRRLKLDIEWSRPVEVGEDGARLMLGRQGALVVSPRAVHAFRRSGRTAFRRFAARGVAVAPSGEVLCATEDRLVAFHGAEAAARWARDADGAHLGPTLLSHEGAFIAPLAGRGALAVDALVGRELWRLDPPRSTTAHLSWVHGQLLVSTDGGDVVGVRARDGGRAFHLKTNLPCVGPSRGFGRRCLSLLGRGSTLAVVAFDAAPRTEGAPSGRLAWTRELPLSPTGQAAGLKRRLIVAGGDGGEAVLVCLDGRGRALWQTRTPCDARTVALVEAAGGVVAADARGVCARVLPNGALDWVLGGSAEELPHRVAPVLRRGVLVIPGTEVRVVEPSTGRVLGTARPGPGVADVCVDAALNVYVLRDSRALELYRLGTLLSLV